MPASRLRSSVSSDVNSQPSASGTQTTTNCSERVAPSAQRALNVRRDDGSTLGARSICSKSLRGLRVGAGDEHVGDRPSDERVGGRAEQADDADAALGDRAVGRAEHVAAVGEAEQDLFEVAVDLGCGRGHLAAQKVHAVPIGRRGDWLSAGGLVGEMSRPRRTAAAGADRRRRDPAGWCPSSSPTPRC